MSRRTSDHNSHVLMSRGRGFRIRGRVGGGRWRRLRRGGKGEGGGAKGGKGERGKGDGEGEDS